MRKVLITGGSGFVGGNIVKAASCDWDVYSTFKNHPFAFPGVRTIHMNLEDADEIRDVIKEASPDVVIHCAASSDLDVCEENSDQTYRINTEASGVIAELGRERGFRLIYISTDMVFDGKNGDYKESDECCPINTYGKSKLEAEKIVSDICTNFVIARAALVYGRPLTGGTSFSQRIIETTGEGREMYLFMDQYRTPVLVQDLARAVIELSESEFTGIIHLGGSERCDRYSFGLRLAEIRGISKKMLRPISMNDVQFVAPRPRDTSFNISFARSLLNTELTGWREGLKRA